MDKIKILAVLVFGLLLGALAQPITSSNWATHPQIVEIRKIYQEVQTLTNQNKLKKASVSYEGCAALNLERTLWTLGTGVRLYLLGGGSEDSATEIEYTYDSKGNLRFVLVKAGAVNDTHTEYRYYLNSSKTIIWKDVRSTGPGYPFMDFSQHFVFDPKKDFAAKNPCE